MKQFGWFKIHLLICILFFFFLPATGLPIPQDDISQFPSCHYCGMARSQFANTRIYMTHEDNTTFGVCSLHCATLEMIVRRYKVPKVIMVGDYNTEKLIDAKNAYWVIGGDIMGVMTKRAKWAFARKEEAERFIREHGGELATFDLALKDAFEYMYDDVNMLRKIGRMK